MGPGQPVCLNVAVVTDSEAARLSTEDVYWCGAFTGARGLWVDPATRLIVPGYDADTPDYRHLAWCHGTVSQILYRPAHAGRQASLNPQLRCGAGAGYPANLFRAGSWACRFPTSLAPGQQTPPGGSLRRCVSQGFAPGQRSIVAGEIVVAANWPVASCSPVQRRWHRETFFAEMVAPGWLCCFANDVVPAQHVHPPRWPGVA